MVIQIKRQVEKGSLSVEGRGKKSSSVLCNGFKKHFESKCPGYVCVLNYSENLSEQNPVAAL